MADNNCTKHTFDLAYANCRGCGQGFCTSCLVYAFGPSKPPFCVKCAIAASGVRSNAAPPPTHSKQQVRQMQREAARAAKQSAKSTAEALPAPDLARLEGAAAGTGTSPDEERSGQAPAAAGGKAGKGRLLARFRS